MTKIGRKNPNNAPAKMPVFANKKSIPIDKKFPKYIPNGAIAINSTGTIINNTTTGVSTIRKKSGDYFINILIYIT